MYHIKPIITDFEINYPTCMYKMKNLNAELKTNEDGLGLGVSLTNSTISILDKRINENIQTILKVFKIY